MSKILNIEDEESIAELEKDYLELSGFDVEIENNGESGLDKALHEEFDLVILDLMLPGIDGFEICAGWREVKNTPIIMVPRRKRISIRSAAWDWAPTITSRSHSAK